MKHYWCLLFAGIASMGAASAVTISPCNNCWQAFDPNNIVDATGVASNPYWVNQSQDGSKQGLAFQLSQYSPLQYYSSGAAAPNDAPQDFFFLNSSAQTLQVQFLKGVTLDSLEFGWYDPTAPSVLHPLVTRTGDPGSPQTNPPSGMATFTPTAEFGFYLKYINVPIPGNICAALVAAGMNTITAQASNCYTQAPLVTSTQAFYTQSSKNPTGGTTEAAWESVANIPSVLSPFHQHFVTLLSSNPAYNGDYIFGMEDAFGRDPVQDKFMNVFEGNGDYQDLAFLLSSVDTTATPEPSTFALIGLGLAGVAFFRKRQA